MGGPDVYIDIHCPRCEKYEYIDYEKCDTCEGKKMCKARLLSIDDMRDIVNSLKSKEEE
jgi:phage FluMu protein Com